MNQSDLVIIVGTSLTLRYIADLPFLPKQNGGNVAMINLQPTEDDAQCDLRIFGKCDMVFSLLLKELEIDINNIHSNE